MAGVVAEERGVPVDRDAGSTDRVQRDRRVPRGLARVEVDRRDMRVDEPPADADADGLALADGLVLVDGVALDPGGESPKPSV